MHGLFPWKIKKTLQLLKLFQKKLNQSDRKPNKVWVDKGSEFYNLTMKSFLQNNNIEMYSAHNNRKSVVAERFIGTLKNNIYKYMISIAKSVYTDKLDDIVKKYHHKFQKTFKMKPVDLKSNTYIDSSKEINEKGSKFEISDIVRYQNTKMFLKKVALQIGLKNFLWLKKLKYCAVDICY